MTFSCSPQFLRFKNRQISIEMAGLRASYLGAAAPVALVLAYMLWHEDLQRAAAVLIVCVVFTSAAMYFFYKQSESKVVEALNAGGVDRTLYKVLSYAP